MLPDVPDPTLYAAPFFLLAVLVEAWVLRRQRAAGKDVLGYDDAKDTWASLAMGVGSIFFVTLINAAVFCIATWLWPHRLLDLGEGPLGWAVAMIGWDHQYYWHHRFEHEVRLLWAAHVNHHSSQKYNLSTALRQPWTPWLAVVMYPPLALLGVAPWMILVAGGINLIYQFWVHTEAVDRLPRALERVLNTASHHRVHHGSNGRYLDKNYGGILIVWDRLFGTFEEERERVVYGLTKNITSYNPIVIAFHEYVAIAEDVARARSVREVIGYTLGPPGWPHAASVGARGAKDHDARDDQGSPSP
jgi:sterol desaturase/sphingolipid hydroxylase (fatty acid hydroxylase superfamily)